MGTGRRTHAAVRHSSTVVNYNRVKSTHDTVICGSVVSLSFVFTHPPEDKKNKKKSRGDAFTCYAPKVCEHLYSRIEFGEDIRGRTVGVPMRSVIVECSQARCYHETELAEGLVVVVCEVEGVPSVLRMRLPPSALATQTAFSEP